MFITVTVPLQLSDAVGVPKATPLAVHKLASAETTTVAGQVIVGFLVSFTVTICVQVSVFPAASFAVQVTVVSPIGKTNGALFVTVTVPLQLSDVVGVPKSTPDAVHKFASAETTTVAGQVIIGFWVSFTITFWVAVSVFPLPSLKSHVIV